MKKYFTITDPVIHCPKKISVKLSNDHLNWNKLDFEDLYNGTDDNTIRKEYPTDDLYSNNVDGNKKIKCHLKKMKKYRFIKLFLGATKDYWYNTPTLRVGIESFKIKEVNNLNNINLELSMGREWKT